MAIVVGQFLLACGLIWNIARTMGGSTAKK